MERKIKARNWAGGLQANKTVIHIHSCKLAQKELQSKEVGRERQWEEGDLDLIMAENNLGAFFFLSHIHLDKNNKD